MKHNKPMWWLLYAIVPLMMGALLLETQVPLTTMEHRIAEGAIVVVGFALMIVWSGANEGAVWDEELRKAVWRPVRREEEEKRSHPIALAPRVRLAEPPPRTGFGSQRGRRQTKREAKVIGTNMARVAKQTDTREKA